jgi:hypothetical protein
MFAKIIQEIVEEIIGGLYFEVTCVKSRRSDPEVSDHPGRDGY